MILLNGLKPAAGSRKMGKRVGRGQGSGSGCTSGRGNNGAKGRSGSRYKMYFEGGQTPLIRRIPKKGFFNKFKAKYQIVNVSELDKLDVQGKEINAEILFEKGLIHSKKRPIKILGNGEISRPLVIKADAYTKSAREKLKMPKAGTR